MCFIRVVEECNIYENNRKTQYQTEYARDVPEVLKGNLPPVEIIKEEPDKSQQHGSGTFYGKKWIDTRRHRHHTVNNMMIQKFGLQVKENFVNDTQSQK